MATSFLPGWLSNNSRARLAAVAVMVVVVVVVVVVGRELELELGLCTPAGSQLNSINKSECCRE